MHSNADMIISWLKKIDECGTLCKSWFEGIGLEFNWKNSSVLFTDHDLDDILDDLGDLDLINEHQVDESCCSIIWEITINERAKEIINADRPKSEYLVASYVCDHLEEIVWDRESDLLKARKERDDANTERSLLWQLINKKDNA